MRIDSISAQPDRAGRYRIGFDDGSTMRLYKQTVQDFGLYTGQELDEEALDNLRTAAGAMSAKMRAVRIISASSVSKGDLQQRLVQKGEDPDQAMEAVQWMEELNLLDDRKTAEQVVQRCISKGYGLARVKQALYEKRIPKSYWQEVLADYPDQTDAIITFLRSRLGESWEERDLRRATDALIRRGHSYSEIRRGLQAITDSDDFTEDSYG